MMSFPVFIITLVICSCHLVKSGMLMDCVNMDARGCATTTHEADHTTQHTEFLCNMLVHLETDNILVVYDDENEVSLIKLTSRLFNNYQISSWKINYASQSENTDYNNENNEYLPWEFMQKHVLTIILLINEDIAKYIVAQKFNRVNHFSKFTWIVISSYARGWDANLQIGDKVIVVEQSKFNESRYEIWNKSLMKGKFDLFAYGDEIWFSRSLASIWKTEHLNGRHFIITTYPLVVFHDYNSTSKQWYGICIDILNSLAESLQFTYELVLPADEKWGSRETNGSWNGMVGQVKRGEVDWAMGKFTVTDARNEVIDYTSAFWHESSLFVMRHESKLDLFVFLKPFKKEIWLFVFILSLCTSAILASIHFMEQYIYKGTDQENKSPYFILKTAIWQIMISLLQQGSTRLPQMNSTRIIIGFWWILSIIISAIYTGNLIAFLAVPTYDIPIRTLQELTNSDYTFGTLKGAALSNLFEQSKSGIYKKLWNMSIQFEENNVDTDSQGLQRVKDEQYIFIEEESELATLVYSDCDFMVGEERFFPSSFAFIFPEKSPYLPLFNSKISKLVENGMVVRYKHLHYPVDECSSVKENRISTKYAAKINDMFGTFILLGCGLIISLLALILEHCICWKSALINKDLDEHSSTSCSVESNNHFQMYCNY